MSTKIMVSLLLATFIIHLSLHYPALALGGNTVIDIGWNGTSWGVLEEKNGTYHIILIQANTIDINLNITGIACGLVWNGSSWIIESFVPDKVILQNPEGREILSLHSYDCLGSVAIDGTYLVPVSESAMMGICSVVIVDMEKSIQRSIPCGYEDGVRIKVYGGKVYFANCTGVYIYQEGVFKKILPLRGCLNDFAMFKHSLAICGKKNIIEPNATLITIPCDVIECNSNGCLFASNSTLYAFDGQSIQKLKLASKSNNLSKLPVLDVILVFFLLGIVFWLIVKEYRRI